MIPSPGGQGGGEVRAKAYVYLLKSRNKGFYYVGWTTDLYRRLEEHYIGESPYTKARGPWELVTVEAHESLHAAKQRERLLKRNPRMLAQFKKRALNVFRTANGGPRQVMG